MSALVWLCVFASALCLVSILLLLLPVSLEAKLSVNANGARAEARLLFLGGLLKLKRSEAVKRKEPDGFVFCDKTTARYGKSVFDPAAYANVKKRRKRKHGSGVKLAARLLKATARALSVQRAEVVGRLGIAGAADKTVLTVGNIRVFVLTAFSQMPKAVRRFSVEPDFTGGVIDVKALCILNAQPGKLIIEYLKEARRSK